jgi:type I restriction enzyme S subunit
MAIDSRRLGDYFTLRRGTTYQSNRLGEPGPVLLGLASIGRNGGFRRDSLQTYGGESPRALLVRPGDLYVSLKDVTQSGDLLGAVALLPKDHVVGRLTQDTVRLDAKSNAVPIEYVHWVLRTPEYRDYCRAHATGTTNLGLPRDDFLAFPIPEITPTRRTIVEALDALDDKIELNRRIVESCRELAKAGLQTAAAGAPSVRVGDVAMVERGLAYTSAGLAEHGTPMVNLGSAANLGWLKRSGFKRYVGPHKDRHLVGPWGLLVTSVEQTWSNEILGWPLLVPEDAGRVLFSQDLYAVRFRPGDEWRSLPVWAGMFLQESRAWLEAHIYGSTVARIPRASIEELRVPCPDAGHPAIVLGESLLRRAWAAEVETKSLAALRDALLTRLISGDVRVGSPERVLEHVPL